MSDEKTREEDEVGPALTTDADKTQIEVLCSYCEKPVNGPGNFCDRTCEMNFAIKVSLRPGLSKLEQAAKKACIEHHAKVGMAVHSADLHYCSVMFKAAAKFVFEEAKKRVVIAEPSAFGKEEVVTLDALIEICEAKK